MEVEYTRLKPLEVQRLYTVMDVAPVQGVYQVMSGDSLWKADPLGLWYYVYGEGEIEQDIGYDGVAASLDLPVHYVIGFDISYEGANVREQVEAAALDVDIDDRDLWIGSGDGAKCRVVLIGGGDID